MTDRPRRYVIVGNGFAGTTAAEHLRKLDPASSIHLFGDEPYPLYNRIALPPLVRKQVTASKVIMRDLAWHEKHRITLVLGTRVTKIVPSERAIIADGRTYAYDALLLAVGGRPNPSTVPGAAGAENILNFQYLDDANTISERLEAATSTIAVGGSFIAYELAEAFISRGLPTHWLVRGPRFLRRMLEEDAGALIDEAARADNVQMHYDDEVAEIKRLENRATGVVTKKGAVIDADLIGVGLGITIHLELAEGTAIQTGVGFRCNERLATDEPGIYAAGDCAEFFDPAAGMHYRMGTWNNAGAHGKVAAQNMAGGDVVYHDVPEYSSKIFTGQAITQFGISPELRPDLTIVRKLDTERKEYRALFFDGERFAGGVLIGKQNRAGKRRYLDAVKGRILLNAAEQQAALDWTSA